MQSKHMSMSHHHNALQNQNTKITTKTSDSVAKFKYLQMIATEQNYIHKKVKRKLNLRNSCYLTVQNLLSSHFLSKT
jgi:hypothetical protein